MTAKEFSKRRALIVRRARATMNPDDEPVVEVAPADAPPPIDHESDDVFENRARAGAEWVARHRGLIGDFA